MYLTSKTSGGTNERYSATSTPWFVNVTTAATYCNINFKYSCTSKYGYSGTLILTQNNSNKQLRVNLEQDADYISSTRNICHRYCFYWKYRI